MKVVALPGLVFGLAIGGAMSDDVVKELAPTGTLRVGIAYAPTATPIFAVKDQAGEVHGVPRDLGIALAKQLGVPFEIVTAATTAELTEACSSGAIDIAFMPVDEERRKRLAFSPAYFVIENTYLIAGRPDIKTIADVDRTDVTVVGIAGSTTIRAAGRTLRSAKVAPARSFDDAMAMLKAGAVQGFALTHDSLPKLQKQLPGSRILDGAFQTTDVAIALQKNHAAALACVTDFVKSAKANGVLRKAFDDAGLNDLPIAS
jgi:polar amino acid transport system substrate-binding protein